MELCPQHSWHPMVIHFPLVALLLAVSLDVVEVWFSTARWRGTAALLWWVGLLGAGAAVTTGLIAYNRVEHSELAHVQMTLHRNLALVVVGVLVVTALWRWRHPSSRLVAGVGVVGAIGLLGVGYLGGNLVFRHAIGVPTEVIERVMMERGGHSHQGGAHGDAAAGGDSTNSPMERGHRP